LGEETVQDASYPGLSRFADLLEFVDESDQRELQVEKN
jgi:hypothetical protein